MNINYWLTIPILIGGFTLAKPQTCSVHAEPLPSSLRLEISQAISEQAPDYLKVLDTIPVFGLMDSKGDPLLASGDVDGESRRLAIFWLDPKDAAEALNEVLATTPELGAEVQVQPLALGQVLMFAESNDMPADWRLQVIPKAQDVAAARAILELEDTQAAEQFDGIPVFFATTEDELLVVEYEGEQIVPLFMSKADLQVALLKLVRIDPTVPRLVKIDVTSLENVLAILSGPEAEVISEPVLFVPNWQAEQAAEFLELDL